MNNVAEAATGVVQRGKLNFQTRQGSISVKEAKRRIYANEEVAVPAAGAGSYDEVFSKLGFSEVELIESGSSAGDWTFGVKDNFGWRVAYQENRYPYFGYRYYINTKDFYGYTSFEDLMQALKKCYA